MKQLFIKSKALILFILISVIASGCGSSDQTTASANEIESASIDVSIQDSTSSEDTSNATTTSEDVAITLRLSSTVPSVELEANKTAMARGLNTWIETVEAESNGTITIQLFSDGQLASKADQVVNGIQSGGFEVAHFATGNWAEYTNAFAELNVPYLYSSYDSAHRVMDSDIGLEMISKLEEDVPSIKGLSYIDIGFRHVTNSKGIIESPADLDGVKIRTMNDKLQIAAMEALGATVTPLPFSELYSALQQGLVDAQENPLSTIYNNKLYEVNEYVTLTNHTFTSTIVFMNSDVYESLSEVQKQAISLANEACSQTSRDAAEEGEAEFITLLENQGMNVYQPTEDQLKAFRDQASTSWTLAEELMGEDRYQHLLEVVEGE